jgi:hypothetical protein
MANDISENRVAPERSWSLSEVEGTGRVECSFRRIYALNFPPNSSSALMICADHSAISSSRRVRSAD